MIVFLHFITTIKSDIGFMLGDIDYSGGSHHLAVRRTFLCFIVLKKDGQ